VTDADVPGTLVPREQPCEEAWLRGIGWFFDQIIHRSCRQCVPFLFPVQCDSKPLHLFRQITDTLGLLNG
jgi:hypothetical protein